MANESAVLLGEAVSRGDDAVSERLLPAVYAELRRLAHYKIAGEPAGQSLQATALVHEAYLRLACDREVRWKSRHHFFGAAAQAMRRILIERARRRSRVRHGGGLERASAEIDLVIGRSSDEFLDLDRAISQLERIDPRRSEVVKLRYFVGLTIAETADVLRVSTATVKLDWVYARAWLHREVDDARPT